MARRPLIVIAGPTAGGKTTLAVMLALRLPGGGECIGADSMQVYRGIDVGTAKPTADERAGVPHHLIDVADPAEDGFSIDRWLGLADAAIDAIRARGRWPIVVGGTNLYIQALMKGMTGGPPPDPDLRRRLQAEEGHALRRRLERVDPAAAERIHPNDRKRAIRAIEVFERTGRPISVGQSHWSAPGQREDALLVVLDYPAESINPRINRRVREMVEGGLFEETEALLRSGGLGVQAREALGYRQAIDHLEGRLGRQEAIEQIKIRTRRFAKQQRSWLRRFRALEGVLWLDADALDAQALCEAILREALRRSNGPGGSASSHDGGGEESVDRSSRVD